MSRIIINRESDTGMWAGGVAGFHGGHWRAVREGEETEGEDGRTSRRFR